MINLMAQQNEGLAIRLVLPLLPDHEIREEEENEIVARRLFKEAPKGWHFRSTN